MVKTLDSFSTLISLLTGTFLLKDELFHPSQEKISKAVADHQATFTGLKKYLAEARSERLCNGPTTSDPYEDAVDSLTRLAQHLNGLRSGTSLQYDFAKAHRDGKVALRSSHGKTSFANVLETNGDVKGKAAAAALDDTEDVMLRAAAAMFGDLVGELDSPLRALSVSTARVPFFFLKLLAHLSLMDFLFWDSRHAHGPLGVFERHSRIRGHPRTLNPFWMNPSILRMGYSERCMNSIAPLTTPCCASTVASTPDLTLL